MKLEVGMYCRYNNFQNKIKIAKIKGIQKADEVFQYDYISFDDDDGTKAIVIDDDNKSIIWENKDIKSVITHGQMEHMAYKVGE